MTHPIYTRQLLEVKGLVKLKKIAQDLGVNPVGDKRSIQSWVNAIVEYQASQAQVVDVEVIESEIETAIIDYDDSIDGLTQPYVVVANSEIVHRAATHALAERYCKWHSLTVIDSQTLAQNELEIEMEAQAAARTEKAASVEVIEQHLDEGFVKFVVVNLKSNNHYTVTPAHPVAKKRCECGDSHFRGFECKHQIAVKNELISQIQFVSPTGFGNWEAIVNNEVIGVIEQDFDSGVWRMGMRKGTKSFDSYLEAENFIKDEYVGDYFMNGRGSGRIEPVIEEMGLSIEDSCYTGSFGQSYTVRIDNHLAGSIFLNDDHGWTLDGIDFNDDWRPVASELVKLTRREYEHLLAA